MTNFNIKPDLKKVAFIVKMIIFLLLCSVVTVIKAQISPDRQAKTSINLISQQGDETVISFIPGGVVLEKPFAGMPEVFPRLDKGTPVNRKGYPDMDKLTTSLIIPHDKEMQVEVIRFKYEEINASILPSKGTLSREIDPASIPYEKADVYSANTFFPSDIISLGDPYILRDHCGQSLTAFPFQYNPVTGVLRIYTEITIRVKPTGKIINNRVERKKPTTSVPTDFKEIYNRRFINYEQQLRYSPLEEDGNMLIICYGPFMAEMQDFVKWKKEKGIPVEIVDVATIGASDEIRSYVNNYYYSKGLTYLLLVGDHQQVPSFSAPIGMSDNYYGYISGDDHYPEIFVGRFSAENTDDVASQVDRTIAYEKYPDTSATWYKNALGIASLEGPGDDGEFDFEHIRNIGSKLLNYTYILGNELYEGDQGGQDSIGSPVATDVLDLINKTGYSIINYCGHGWSQGWGTSGFSNNEIAQITNYHQLPFIFSVACSNGDFTKSTCFGEQWLRQQQGGQAVGAIAVLMSTISQYWSEPMEAQDEMNDLLTERLSHSKHSFGGISMNGCMKMNDAYGQGGFNMTDTWTIFGDPSVVIRTDTPVPMDVNHEATIQIGSENTNISCNIENALVCLTIRGEIIGRGYIKEGIANISFEHLSVIDTILVTITAYNKIPYFGQINILPPPGGSYVIHSSFLINDKAGNNNQLADFGEDILLDVSLKNIGISDALGVTAQISTNDPYITITNNTGNWSTIAADTSLLLTGAFAFSVADSIPEQHPVRFSIVTTDAAGNKWFSNVNIVLNAPILMVGTLTTKDESGGNGNGILEPGETADIMVQTINLGQASCALTGFLSSSYTQMTINNSTTNIGTIMPGDTLLAIFNITISPEAQIGQIADFAFETSSLPYIKSKNFHKMIGQFSENWETAHFSKYNWLFRGHASWKIIDSMVYEGDHSARSGAITHDQYSELSVSMTVSIADSISFYRKVSSEKDWDWLNFSIDSVGQDQWTGEVDWAREAYPVNAGMHTFSWRFRKDNVDYDPIGYDCGLVDYILFPPSTSMISSVTNYTPDRLLECKVFPNPTTGKITLQYYLGEKSKISLRITDMAGNIISILKNRGNQQKGSYDVTFDLSDLPSGSYFIRLETENQVMTERVVFVK